VPDVADTVPDVADTVLDTADTVPDVADTVPNEADAVIDEAAIAYGKVDMVSREVDMVSAEVGMVSCETEVVPDDVGAVLLGKVNDLLSGTQATMSFGAKDGQATTVAKTCSPNPPEELTTVGVVQKLASLTSWRVTSRSESSMISQDMLRESEWVESVFSWFRKQKLMRRFANVREIIYCEGTIHSLQNRCLVACNSGAVGWRPGGESDSSCVDGGWGDADDAGHGCSGGVGGGGAAFVGMVGVVGGDGGGNLAALQKIADTDVDTGFDTTDAGIPPPSSPLAVSTRVVAKVVGPSSVHVQAGTDHLVSREDDPVVREDDPVVREDETLDASLAAEFYALIDAQIAKHADILPIDMRPSYLPTP
jgi:hypothetical protein